MDFPRLTRTARTILDFVDPRKGERIAILCRRDCLALGEEVALQAGDCQVVPLLLFWSDEMRVCNAYRIHIDPEMSLAPWPLASLLPELDALVILGAGEGDPRRFSEVPSASYLRYRQWERRQLQGRLGRQTRWLEVAVPTPSESERLGLNHGEVEEMFLQAMEADPEYIGRKGQALADAIEEAETVRIGAGRGPGFQVSLGGRPVYADLGRWRPGMGGARSLPSRLPAGEICVAPIEESANGSLTVALALYQGRVIRDLQLEFVNGRAFPVLAQEGFEHFLLALDSSGGDRDRFGAISIGINPQIQRLTANSLLNTRATGMVRIRLGDNAEYGGKNRSELQLDLFLERPTIMADDTKIVDRGRLLI